MTTIAFLHCLTTTIEKYATGKSALAAQQSPECYNGFGLEWGLVQQWKFFHFLLITDD
jgi:hypothetical protein